MSDKKEIQKTEQPVDLKADAQSETEDVEQAEAM